MGRWEDGVMGEWVGGIGISSFHLSEKPIFRSLPFFPPTPIPHHPILPHFLPHLTQPTEHAICLHPGRPVVLHGQGMFTTHLEG